MPLQATSGAASYDAFGGGVVAEPNYIESVFSTYLYTGNSSTQTITNGIDLSTKGGLVWTKARPAPVGHGLVDTARGGTKLLQSNTTAAEDTFSSYITSFNANGYTLGASGVLNDVYSMVSWTFRKQPKFFDIVTWTGDGTTNRAIPHNLGSTPGCYIVKSTSAATDWIVWHRSLTGNSYNLVLNTTAAQANYGLFSTTAPNSTNIYLGTAYPAYYNDSGQTYVAYIFAHDAGGFGLTGTDNVISCGSVTTDGSGVASVTLGYEPQLVLMKNTQTAGDWILVDNMRGFSQTSFSFLAPNTSSAEGVQTTDKFYPTATGFYRDGLYASQPHIYIAIRRGPMKVPTSGTSVFSPVAYTGNGGTQNLTTNFAGDMAWITQRDSSGYRPQSFDKLRGGTQAIYQSSTSAEQTNSPTSWTVTFNNTQTALVGSTSLNGFYNENGIPQIAWNFRRAPSFFDVVCYMGTGVTTNFTHNLGVVPEMIITKKRSNTGPWSVYTSATGNTDYLDLHTNNAVATNTSYYNSTTPTASVFTLGSSTSTNTSSQTYVAYLFATCAGVSKVGSYVGTGTTNQIDCGFTGGARFVMIKRTDNYNADVGNWYVWDSARGIVSGNDPYLFINSTAAEVTNTDYIDPYSAGFEISSTAPNGINQSSANYIFLAIA